MSKYDPLDIKEHKKIEIHWLKDSKAGNYPAALSYLSLIFYSQPSSYKQPRLGPEEYVGLLKEAPVVMYKAKDIFRASGLNSLPYSNYHIQKNIRKIQNGEAISPILLVRYPELIKVIIADGWHRLCAIHQLDEDADIHCKIV